MRWGRIEVNGSFLLLLAWMNYLDTQMIVPMALIACVCHELGHYVALRFFGNNIRYLRLTAVGAEMLPEKTMGYGQEFVTVLAGPLTSFALGIVFCQWCWGQLFAGVNFVLGCFNIFPVSRLDGGRLLRCLFSLIVGPDFADYACGLCDTLFTVLLFILGVTFAVLFGNLTLLTVSLWLTMTYFDGKKGKKGLPDWV